MERTERRILVVDDDDAIRALLLIILRRRGFTVDTARNGVEALSRLQTCSYSVMLLDLMMPRMNGWDVLAELKGLPGCPLVIALTAGHEPRDLDPAIVAGTVRKPFDVELLLETIAACANIAGNRAQLTGCGPAESESRTVRNSTSGDRKIN